MRSSLWLILFMLGSMAGQTAPQSEPQKASAIHEEFRLEGDRFHDSCLGFAFAGCAQVLFTDHPLHIAVGSIAPQNGFAAGLALNTHHDASRAFLKWDFDVVGSSNGSWRAGAFMKIIPVPKRNIQPHITPHVSGSQPAAGPSPTPHQSNIAITPHPIFDIYAQAISLNKIGFFGLGPNTTTAGRTFFGMQGTIAGGSAAVPFPKAGKLNLSLLGEINGRFVDIRAAHGEPSPSIEQVYNPVTAPGLASQPGFIQFGEGVRFAPQLEYLYFDYKAYLREFVAPSDSTFSFRRFTIDLNHEIPLYGHKKDNPTGVALPPNPQKSPMPKVDLSSPAFRSRNSPNGCGKGDRDVSCPTIKETICDAQDLTDPNKKCTEVRSAVSRNREGSIGLRLVINESIASGGSVVPFYFQPTIGGSDINGNFALNSYQDYRFRAPNTLLLRETLDHSLYGPVGITLIADQGKAALARGDIDFSHLRHSFAAGLNVRAGALPQIYLLFAFGGKEGTHFTGSVNPALLGGSPRPSLY
jgi:hypothetical protein